MKTNTKLSIAVVGLSIFLYYMIYNQTILVTPTLVPSVDDSSETIIDVNPTQKVNDIKKPFKVVNNVEQTKPMNYSVGNRQLKKHIQNKFDTEMIDHEWSYEQSNNIRETLNDLLSEQGFWVDSLECKSSACKLKIASSTELQSFAPGVSNIMRELDKSSWSKESLDIVSLITNNDVKSAEIMIMRKL